MLWGKKRKIHKIFPKQQLLPCSSLPLFISFQCLPVTHMFQWKRFSLSLASGICLTLKIPLSFHLTSLPTHNFSSVAQLCPTPCDPMNRSTPSLTVHHQLPELTQTHVHWVGDAIQPSHPLSSPSPPAPNPSQHQGLFQWVNSLHQVAKVLKFQLQNQSFQ